MTKTLKEHDIILEVRSIKDFLDYLTFLFTDGFTQESRRLLREGLIEK